MGARRYGDVIFREESRSPREKDSKATGYSLSNEFIGTAKKSLKRAPSGLCQFIEAVDHYKSYPPLYQANQLRHYGQSF